MVRKIRLVRKIRDWFGKLGTVKKVMDWLKMIEMVKIR